MTYDNNLINVFSKMFAITISLFQDTSEIIHWWEEYERFLIFLLIATTNMKNFLIISII